MALEYAFELASSSIRFGPGVSREVGMDLAEMKVQKVMVLTDANLARLKPVATVVESLRDNKIPFALFDRVRVEPTDVSFREAIDFAFEGGFDAFVAVGGGSTMDTAKAANLYSTYPADFLEYVNAPIGLAVLALALYAVRASRDTAATRRRMLTSLGASTCILLMSCLASGTKRAASRRTSSASAALPVMR